MNDISNPLPPLENKSYVSSNDVGYWTDPSLLLSSKPSEIIVDSEEDIVLVTTRKPKRNLFGNLNSLKKDSYEKAKCKLNIIKTIARHPLEDNGALSENIHSPGKFRPSDVLSSTPTPVVNSGCWKILLLFFSSLLFVLFRIRS